MRFLVLQWAITQIIIINRIHTSFKEANLAIRTVDDLGGCAISQTQKRKCCRTPLPRTIHDRETRRSRGANGGCQGLGRGGQGHGEVLVKRYKVASTGVPGD